MVVAAVIIARLSSKIARRGASRAGFLPEEILTECHDPARPVRKLGDRRADIPLGALLCPVRLPSHKYGAVGRELWAPREWSSRPTCIELFRGVVVRVCSVQPRGADRGVVSHFFLPDLREVVRRENSTLPPFVLFLILCLRPLCVRQVQTVRA